MSAAIKTEELLLLITYCLEGVMFPTVRQWNESYEGWLYRNGLLRRLQYLEAQRFLTRERQGTDWVLRLTHIGRSRALGGRDPKPRWQRPWDGWWRQIVFDLPVTRQRCRSSLVRWLRSHGFGYLQDSVWISPDPIREVATALKGYQDDAASFTILECRCARGFSNASLVNGAWPFDRINDAYHAYEQFVKGHLRAARRARLHPRDLFPLLRHEREQWQRAFALDPLLPQPLLPADYAGQRAWRLRQRLLTQLAAESLPG